MTACEVLDKSLKIPRRLSNHCVLVELAVLIVCGIPFIMASSVCLTARYRAIEVDGTFKLEFRIGQASHHEILDEPFSDGLFRYLK